MAPLTPGCHCLVSWAGFWVVAGPVAKQRGASIPAHVLVLVTSRRADPPGLLFCSCCCSPSHVSPLRAGMSWGKSSRRKGFPSSPWPVVTSSQCMELLCEQHDSPSVGKAIPSHRVTVVGGSLKLLLRVSIWEFGAQVDSEKGVLRVRMGLTAVISREQHLCSFQPRKSLDVWLLVGDRVFQGYAEGTVSRSCITEASSRGNRWLWGWRMLWCAPCGNPWERNQRTLPPRAPTCSSSLHIPEVAEIQMTLLHDQGEGCANKHKSAQYRFLGCCFTQDRANPPVSEPGHVKECKHPIQLPPYYRQLSRRFALFWSKQIHGVF